MPDASVEITSRCGCAASGTFLLPRGSDAIDSIVVTARGKAQLLNGGLRNEEGTSACGPVSLVESLGGEGAPVSYRRATTTDLVRYRPGAIADAFIALLTFIGAAFTAYDGFLKAGTDKSDPFGAFVAPFLFAVACITAVRSLIKDLDAAQ
jgi:hypothetical protein